ncbi:MAG: M48 family metallopeptidase [Lewinellaceae bacterium]|nr:M48 family metallopeptidase [Lewinellaceae bacterium]
MEKYLFSIVVISMLAACSTVPITGRKQLSLIPASTMLSLSQQSYRQVLNESKVSSNQAETTRLRRVGNRITQSVESYLRQNNASNLVANYQWEVNLIESPEVNAWCMEGGKIAFYTGIMPLMPNDDAIAVVMSHEIAHAVARHGGERMSQMLVTQLGGVAIDVALRDQPSTTRGLAQVAYGAGTQLGVLLPFSRSHESEADEMGLHFLVMAGYNPEEAVRFWERMSAQSGGKQPLQFLSTHPSHEARIANLKRLIPLVKAKYGK